MPMYRGQTTTTQKIQAISTLRITTKEEAIAFLRAISNIHLQIADVLQRQNMQELSAKNNARAVKELEKAAEVQVAPAEPVQTEEPISFDEEEGHTEEQKSKLLGRLKKAVK